MNDLIVIIVTCAIAFCIYHYGIKPKRARKKDAAGGFSKRLENNGTASDGIPPLDVSGMGLGLSGGIYSPYARYGGVGGMNPMYMNVPSSALAPARIRFQSTLLELAETDAETEDNESITGSSCGVVDGISETTLRQVINPAVDRILAALYNRGAYGVRLSFVLIGAKLMVCATYALPPSEL